MITRIVIVSMFLSLILQGIAFSQTQNEEKEFSKAIEDNSFFIEEAYNQEEGVVQHISNAAYFKTPFEEIIFSFTQEWPLGSQKHQLSATIPYSSVGSGIRSGFNDIMINYRYQLSNDPHNVVVAPRLSVILPTGNSNSGFGSGVLGWQLNLPMSKRLSDDFIVHANAGAMLLPQVKGADSFGTEIQQTLVSYNIGTSLIWLTSYRFNIMAEIVENFMSEIDASGSISHTNETIISPGVRYAIDVGELQIVPGLALPTSIQQGESRTGLFFYLSFEHPF